MAIQRNIGLLITCLGIGLMVISGLAAMAGKSGAGDVEGAGAFYGIAIVIGLVGVWVFRKGKQLRVFSAGELIARDSRQPILYLRSFQSDAISSRAAAGSVSQNIVRTAIPQNVLGEEEQIALVMNNIGPFIGIGEPGELLPKLGAARIYVDDDSWQYTVRHYAKLSSIVLLRVGETAGFRWELENISQLTDPERIIFLLPESEQGYQVFREQAKGYLPAVLPAELSPSNFAAGSFGGLLWFEPDWTAHVERCGMSFIVATNNIASELHRLIQPAIMQLGLACEHKSSGLGRRFAAFVADAAILGATISILSLTVDQLAPDNPDRGLGVMLFGVVLTYFYFGLEGTPLRATPGKKMMDLEVRDRHGAAISFQHALLRFSIWFVEVATVWLILASAVMLLLKRRTICDRLTRTQVIELRRPERGDAWDGLIQPIDYKEEN